MADCWAHFVHCVSGQPLDPPDTILHRRGTISDGPFTHTVQPGDTLVRLARKYYGDGTLWRHIYDANRQTIGPDPGKIYPKQELTIPAPIIVSGSF